MVAGKANKSGSANAAPPSADGFAWRFSLEPEVGWLYDFAVNKADLRPAHKHYLDRTARRIAADKGKVWNVLVEGRASRTGTETHNLMLSLERANAAMAYLKARVPSAAIVPYPAGEYAAASAGEPDRKENMFFRAVIVYVWGVNQPKPLPPPPPPPPRRETKTKTLQLKVLGGERTYTDLMIVPVGAVTTSMVVEIRDTQAKLACKYEIMLRSHPSVGKSWFAPPIYSTRIAPADDWSAFEVPNHWGLAGIAEDATLLEIGATTGKWSFGPSHLTIGHVEGHTWRGDVVQQVKVKDVSISEFPGAPGVGATYSYGKLRPIGKPEPYIDGK